MQADREDEALRPGWRTAARSLARAGRVTGFAPGRDRIVAGQPQLLGPHQGLGAAGDRQLAVDIPGVLLDRGDRVVRQGWPDAETPFRYMTEAYFPDIKTFEKSFFDPAYQADLAGSLQRIAEPLFLISEEVLSEVS